MHQLPSSRYVRSGILLLAQVVLIILLTGTLPAQAGGFGTDQIDGVRDRTGLQATQSTTTTIASNLNPSLVGQPVSFTVTVTSSSDVGTPTGTVEIFDGSTSLGTATLVNGAATFITTFTAFGSHSVAATYSGDATFNTSTGFADQVVLRPPTATTLVSSANPSAFGQLVTFTATVTATNGGGTPTGYVGFSLPIGFPLSAPLDSNGQASVTISFQAFVGSFTVTANYGGDDHFAPSSSPPLFQSVGAASTNMALTSSINPSIPGQPVTFTATVTTLPPGSGTPVGLVSFTLDSISQSSVYLNNGVATLTVSGLTPGEHTLYAYYFGTSQFSFSAATLTQVAAFATTIQQDIRSLIDTIHNMNIQPGVLSSLDAKLQAALGAVNAPQSIDTRTAINTLNAFIHEVQAQQGKTMTDADANTLIGLANNVIGRLSS
ncbi:MAG: Ig-like domain-containing protein [Chloroflexota bacterium]